jgi:hypothetical protein
VAGRDLDISQVHPGVEHGRDEGVPEHVGMRTGDPYARHLGEAPEPPGGGVPVHAPPVAVEQDRAGRSGTDGAVDGPSDRWR